MAQKYPKILKGLIGFKVSISMKRYIQKVSIGNGERQEPLKVSSNTSKDRYNPVSVYR